MSAVRDVREPIVASSQRTAPKRTDPAVNVCARLETLSGDADASRQRRNRLAFEFYAVIQAGVGMVWMHRDRIYVSIIVPCERQRARAERRTLNGNPSLRLFPRMPCAVSIAVALSVDGPRCPSWTER